MSLKDKIKKAKDIQSESVEVPEWGVTVEVRTISAKQRAQIFEQATDNKGNVQTDVASLLLVMAATHDPTTGEAVFSPEDADWLGDKSSSAVGRIGKVASRLAGIERDFLELAEKNLSKTPSYDSPTG